jgi:hypothetical protein
MNDRLRTLETHTSDDWTNAVASYTSSMYGGTVMIVSICLKDALYIMESKQTTLRKLKKTIKESV